MALRRELRISNYKLFCPSAPQLVYILPWLPYIQLRAKSRSRRSLTHTSMRSRANLLNVEPSDAMHNLDVLQMCSIMTIQEVVVVFAQAYDNLVADSFELCTCPRLHHRHASQPTFRVTRPTKPVWCCSCKKFYSGIKWFCPCGRPWATCDVHVNRLPVRLIKKRISRLIMPDTAQQSERKKFRLEQTASPAPPTDRLVFQLRGNLVKRFPRFAPQS